LKITGVANGSAKIIVTDVAGALVSIDLIVSSGTVIPLYTSALPTMTIAINAEATFIIAGGTPQAGGIYRVTSSNSAVLSVSPNPTTGPSFTIKALATGSATVGVFDNLGASVQFSVTVSPVGVTPITVLPGDATGAVGDTLTFKVTGGSPTFTLNNSNPSIATVTPTTLLADGVFTAKLLNVGSTVVNVLDSQGITKAVTVTATAANSLLRISPSTMTISENSTNSIDINIYGGTAPYRVFTSDLNLSSVPATVAAVVPAPALGYTFAVGLGANGNRCIAGLDAGGTYVRFNLQPMTITVIDSIGASATLTMNIKDNGEGLNLKCPFP
jgi:hypothetical protein